MICYYNVTHAQTHVSYSEYLYYVHKFLSSLYRKLYVALLFTSSSVSPHQTPPKFNWSIDEMASLLPVHIDPEEIQRQSFYLSQTRYVLKTKY